MACFFILTFHRSNSIFSILASYMIRLTKPNFLQKIGSILVGGRNAFIDTHSQRPLIGYTLGNSLNRRSSTTTVRKSNARPQKVQTKPQQYDFGNGKIYLGEMRDGRPEGKGKITKPSGWSCEGTFSNGVCNGTGVIIFPSGSTYEGAIMNDVPHGYGRLSDEKGFSYVGQFVNGQQHGQGKLQQVNGRNLQGEFRNSQIYTGSGVMVSPSGRFEGEWVAGERHGPGKFTYPDGRTLQGEYVRGKLASGHGVLINNDNTNVCLIGRETPTTPTTSTSSPPSSSRAIYRKLEVEGEFRDFKIYTGKGIIKHHTSYYEVEFKEGQMTGNGTWWCFSPSIDVGNTRLARYECTNMHIPSHSVYRGGFYKNRLHGTGVITYPDGSKLSGQFVCGLIRNGQGRLYKASDRSIFDGRWQNGMKHGQGVLTNGDGTTWVGEFRGGKIYTGQGTVCFPYGRVHEGAFREGFLHGPGKITCGLGRTLTGEFRYGRPYHASGTHTLRDGTMFEGTWVNGARTGRGKLTYPTQETLEGEFMHDRIFAGIGTLRTPHDVRDGVWRNGRLHGKGKISYLTGESLEGEFRHGRIFTGKATLLQPDGTMLTELWVNGERFDVLEVMKSLHTPLGVRAEKDQLSARAAVEGEASEWTGKEE